MHLRSLVDGLQIKQLGKDWEGWLNGKKVAFFQYYNDDLGRQWLCAAEVEPRYRRRGIGRHMIAAAVELYGEVYASTASKGEHEEYSDDPDGDTRYMAAEGTALVKACIRAGIMRAEWLCHPFEYEIREDDRADEE